MTAYRLIDLYCGAGGAGAGYAQSRFKVVGVDNKPQPRYPFEFIQADVLSLDPEWIRANFDAIHASPPCQKHTAMKTMHNAKEHLDLIPETQALLEATGLPWVIENVSGAPLENAIQLCGTMFDLGSEGRDLERHRLFQASFALPAPKCSHRRDRGTIGLYGDHVRDRRRREGSSDRGIADPSFEDGCMAMGIDWMTIKELCQAIPPAYTRFIADHLRWHLDAKALIG